MCRACCRFCLPKTHHNVTTMAMAGAFGEFCGRGILRLAPLQGSEAVILIHDQGGLVQSTACRNTASTTHMTLRERVPGGFGGALLV